MLNPADLSPEMSKAINEIYFYLHERGAQTFDSLFASVYPEKKPLERLRFTRSLQMAVETRTICEYRRYPGALRTYCTPEQKRIEGKRLQRKRVARPLELF